MGAFICRLLGGHDWSHVRMVYTHHRRFVRTCRRGGCTAFREVSSDGIELGRTK